MLMLFMALIITPPSDVCAIVTESLAKIMLSVIAHLVLYRGNAKQHKIISVILFAQ